MPRRKKNIIEETPVTVLEEEVQEEIKIVPKRLYVEVKQEVPMPHLNAVGAIKVGTLTYFESTDELIVTSEVEFEEYMTSTGNRNLCLTDGRMVSIDHRKEWMENFHKNTFDNGIFATEVRISNENE